MAEDTTFHLQPTVASIFWPCPPADTVVRMPGKKGEEVFAMQPISKIVLQDVCEYRICDMDMEPYLVRQLLHVVSFSCFCLFRPTRLSDFLPFPTISGAGSGTA